MRKLAAWVFAVAASSGACREGAKPAQTSADAGLFDRSPLSQAELPTTAPEIAVPNFEAQLRGFERLLERSGDLDTLSKVAAMRLLRAQFFSRVSDYERANELAERAVREHARDGRAFLLRARVRAALHRFGDARADLDVAEKMGAAAPYIAEVRSGIEAGQGRPAEALKLLPTGREDSDSLGLRAALTGELGETARAERMFTRAQHGLRDTSPFPLAWLYFHQGLMWQRAGNLPRAKELFEAAYERLPPYAPVIGHLAGTLAAMHEDARAIRLLRPLASSSEDPEYAGQLAGMFEKIATSSASAGAEAELHRARASAGFDELMKKHPEAYADHAARFWLGPGRDPAKAAAAAEKNLEVRETEDALMLALQAAIAARDKAAACRLAERAKSSAPDARHLHALAELAREICGN